MAQTKWMPLPYPRRRGVRLGELLVALALLALTSPLIAFVALAIKCESPGPLISRQQRLGAAGRRFFAYKFRCTTLGFGGQPRRSGHADRNDNITRMGRFLRYTRIENLPQLINVLRGEMSCINPQSGYPFFLD
jgi:lipopolysaccharide/colanic/teichoic acid biosynthesis glycosyltransferase